MSFNVASQDTVSQEYYKQFCLAPLSKEHKLFLQSQKEQFFAQGAFSKELQFGTGGVREIVGLGSNRINIYTIARLIKAIFTIINKQISPNLKIIVGYDSRLSNTYLPALTYSLLKKESFHVHLYDQVVPTPLISFAVHNLTYDIGIMFTASHNPAKYNGLKLYGTDGGQILSPLDKEIQEEYTHISYQDIPKDIHSLSSFDRISSSDILPLKSILRKFYNKIKKEKLIQNRPKKISILYSPLHGTGTKSFSYLFSKFQFSNFSILKEQEKPNGNFPTIKIPNPEEPEAFALLKKQASKTKQTLLLATDPDSDRLGAMIYDKTKEEYCFLTGHQIASLLLDYLGQTRIQTIKNPLACKTIVTSELFSKIAHSYDIEVIETLTGFKYISNEIQKHPKRFIFGAEESFGYLPISWVRDKDSLSTALLLTDYANQTCLINKLKQLYCTHGYYIEETFSINLTQENINSIQKVRSQLKNPQQLIEFLSKSKRSYQVIDSLVLNNSKHQSKIKYIQNLKKDLPTSNVLQLYLKSEGRITIRPSGTESKIKFYISLCSKKKPNMDNLKEIQEKTEKELKFFKNQLMSFFN